MCVCCLWLRIMSSYPTSACICLQSFGDQVPPMPGHAASVIVALGDESHVEFPSTKNPALAHRATLPAGMMQSPFIIRGKLVSMKLSLP